MRKIDAAQIAQAVARLCIEANTRLDNHVCERIRGAHDAERQPAARHALGMILDNMEISGTTKMPLCQDTGLAVVFVRMGQNVHIAGSLADAINAGVRRGYAEGYLRASVVGCPLRRENTADNTPAIIHYDIVPGDELCITVMPKGFGSENKGGVKMLVPADGLPGVMDFVLDCVMRAGADPCPPIFVGVGVGGTMEYAALLAKLALLEIGEPQPDDMLADAQAQLESRINALGIGTAGFGGDITTLGVRIKTHPTHIAGLPVAVNIGCHVCRHAAATL